MNILIVESAAKAKAINKYLGPGFKVLASYGHVSDLREKDGSVDPENDFSMTWEEDGKSAKIMREIADAVKKADKLILATDPDREGEAISWHILRLLEKKKALKAGTPVERVAFNAVTKQAVLDALKHPRKIDEPLVSAYLARRALDYLVGFTLSPVLWRKLPGARSAGRVQSVALRLVCDREAEIEAFKTDEYWTISALLSTARGEDVTARLVSVAGKRLDRLDIKDETSARAMQAAIERSDYRVASVDKKAVRRNPYPPFMTSSLQMDASRKLGFSAKKTMQVAQRLYEGVDIGGDTVGLITYMRTDGITIIPEAISAIRGTIAAEYGQRYVAPVVREYKTKAKNAQEAHEGIRPTDVSRKPSDVAKYLEADQARLYDLIWKRTVASQMASAELEQTSAEIEVKGRDGKTYGLRATGSIVQFDGFLKLYEEGRDDRQRVIDKGKDDHAEEEDDSRRLPPLAAGDGLKDKRVDAEQHFTQPPPRYTEATLVKRMEELGIGRPSTYAATLATLEDRGYVKVDRKRLLPEDKGRLLTGFLAGYFKRYVEYDFTADLEEKLDLISDDKLEYKEVLRDFWKDFTAAIDEIKDLRIGEVFEALNDMLGPHIFPDKGDGSDPRLCPKCGQGRLSLKPSKYGPFVGCSSYPECRYTRQLTDVTGEKSEAAIADGRVLGQDPETGLDVIVKAGRFGTYLQLGEQTSKDEKPKRSSIPDGVALDDVDLELALKLLSLPRDVGVHPETNEPITAALGRYGPYVKHKGTYANLPAWQDLFTIGLNHAVSLIADKAAGRAGRFQRAAPTVLKELGEHPQGGEVKVLEGKYGPYVSHSKVNATLPKGRNPAELTMDEAVSLLEERAAKGGKPKRGSGARTKKAAPASDGEDKPKASAKSAKPGAKKTTAKKKVTEAAES
jgi:DNA topoisomerase-1